MNDKAMEGVSGYERAPNDFYRTESKATIALVRFLAATDMLAPKRKLWEPACGDGAISEVLEDHGHPVYVSDLHPQLEGAKVLDFTFTAAPADTAGIITNPPYLKEPMNAFIERCIWAVRMEGLDFAAMLMRNEVDCGSKRHHYFGGCSVFHTKLVLTWRPKWFETERSSPRHNYAWYIWAKERNGAHAEISYALKP